MKFLNRIVFYSTDWFKSVSNKIVIDSSDMYACAHESTRHIRMQLSNRWPTMCKISRRSIDLFTSEDPAQSMNHKYMIFTGKCNESLFYCLKPKKSSLSKKRSSSISMLLSSEFMSNFDRDTIAPYFRPSPNSICGSTG